MSPYNVVTPQVPDENDQTSGSEVADNIYDSVQASPAAAMNPMFNMILGFMRGPKSTGSKVINDVDNSIDSVSKSTDMTGYDQAAWALEQQWKMDEAEKAFNSAEAAKNRDWQKMMSDTAIQRAVADIKKAGLNPWLALNGGSLGPASTPSGSSASASSGSSKVPENYLVKMLSALITSATGILKVLA